jgi:hypothetical protein
MDVDRRGKTITASTFAIARKSLSNAWPISAVRKAMHCDHAQGKNLVCDRAGGYPSNPEGSPRIDGGKKMGRRSSAAVSPARLFSFSFRSPAHVIDRGDDVGHRPEASIESTAHGMAMGPHRWAVGAQRVFVQS